MKVFMAKLSFYFCVSLMVVSCQGKLENEKIFVAHDYVKSSLQYRKPGPAIELNNSQVNLAVSGVSYAIDLSIFSGYDHGQMTVSISSSEGLYIVGGDLITTTPLTRGKIDIPYTVTAAKEGRYYLYTNVKVEQDGKEYLRALTMIVQVGSFVPQKLLAQPEFSLEEKQSKQSDIQQERMIVLPVDEEVIQ